MTISNRKVIVAKLCGKKQGKALNGIKKAYEFVKTNYKVTETNYLQYIDLEYVCFIDVLRLNLTMEELQSSSINDDISEKLVGFVVQKDCIKSLNEYEDILCKCDVIIVSCYQITDNLKKIIGDNYICIDASNEVALMEEIKTQLQTN